MTENDILKDKYKHLSPEELANYNLLSPARSSGYICPFCGNGTGENGTGIDMKLLSSGYEGNCFKCHTHFDVFKIIAHENNLDDSTQFAQVFQIAREIFGDDVSKIKIVPKTPKTEKPQTDYSANLKKWRANLKEFVKSQGGSYRGLIYEQLAKYYCGYEPNFENKLKDENNVWHTITAPRFIIPTSRNHYLARLIGKAADLPIEEIAKPLLEEKAKQHFGAKDIFGKTFLPKDAKIIFTVEGEFDAMSIDQCGYPAIGIGGSQLSKKMQAELKDFPPDTNFIILLDNDETGNEMARKNAEIIDSLGFSVVIQKIDEKFKDANEFLQADPDGLAKNLEEIFQTAKTMFENAPPKTAAKIPNETIPNETSDETPEKKIEEKKQNIFTTKDVIKNCPIDLNIPENFYFKENGIFKKTKDGSKCLSNSPMVITRIIATPKGEETQIELAIYNRKLKSWSKFILPREILDSKNISALLKLGASIKTDGKKFLPDFFDDLINETHNLLTIPNTAMYTKPGWTDGNCENYIIPPGDGENFIVKNKGLDYTIAFSKKGDKEVWLDYFKRTFSESFLCRIAFGYVLAAPLLEVCGVRNLQLVLVAPSGSGKSAILRLAFSLMGDPEKLKKTFNGTANSILEIATAYNSLPCWIDEYQSAKKGLKSEVENLIYCLAEGTTRTRLTKDIKIRPIETFHATFLYSAEENIQRDSNNQGASARLIELNAQNAIDNDLALEIHRKIKNSYGHFWADWIEYIKNHKEEITSEYEKTLSIFSDRDFLAAHMQALSIVVTANYFFLRMLGISETLMCNCLSDPTDEKSVTQCHYEVGGTLDVFRAREILPSLNETRNTTRALKFISEIIHTYDEFFHHQKFGIITGENAEENDGVYNTGEKGMYWSEARRTPALGVKYLKKEIGGWSENGEIAFWAGRLHKYMEEEGGFSNAKTIMLGLGELGYLEGNKANKFQVSKRYGKNSIPAKFYVFPAGTFDS